ncbi:MAG: thiamine phosphate synthase [Candidatus Omnitrophica bacterium]|nr:thiamine phosphate synthase [Candidatus Omnitrophota bacterium]
MKSISNYNLYLVTGEQRSATKKTLEVVRLAINGGANIIQLRDKNMARSELVSLGKKLSTLAKSKNIVFIVNDDPDLAAELDADGVHLGQTDIEKYSVEKTRKLIGRNKIIGLSTHSLEQIEQANKLDINYIAFGPLFETKTKNYSIGTRDLTKALSLSKFPLVCIGGINSNNIEEVLKLGATNIAMIREITESQDIEKKVKQLKSLITKYKKNADNN